MHLKTGAADAAVFAPDDLLTPEELAQRLKVSVTWVYEQTRARTAVRSPEAIPVVPVGRFLRFYWPAVCGWLSKKSRDRIEERSKRKAN